MIWIAGHCPMGCGQYLTVGEGGALMCSYSGCPRPSAAHEVLSEDETAHVVEIGHGGWSAKHPLRERLGDALLSCSIHEAVEDLVRRQLPISAGRWRVADGDGAWTWTPLP